MTIKKILQEHLVSEIPLAKGQIYEIDSKSDLTNGFNVLIDNGILSAPVWDESTKHYIGFLDVRDLVAFAVFATKENERIQTLTEILSHGTKMMPKAQEGITVSYLCRRNPFKPVKLTDTLESACKILTSGAHRVPVVNENGKVINIVSQSSINNFLLHHQSDEYFQHTVEQLHVGTSPVLLVMEDELALDTFAKMEQTGRSGIAVVDADGQLIGNTSGSDMKLFLKYHETLSQPIIDFLNKIRRMDLKTRAPAFTCKSTETLAQVMAKISATKAHRVFVVDDHHKPIKVISITDILKVAMK